MGVRSRARRFATRRPGVLLVTAPGATATRLAVEAETRRRGWPPATGPADADLLVVAGEPDGWADPIWREIPEPRARITVTDPADVPAALDAREPEASGYRPPIAPDDRSMADRADDRDGLRLDQIDVPLGPALPAWPAGLIVRVRLRGDVVADAEVSHLPVPDRPAFWDEPWSRAATGEYVPVGVAARRLVAAHLDSLGRYLTVVGWGDAAARAGKLRDDILSGAPTDPTGLTRRVRRSRSLRWLTTGLGYDRVLGWLDRIDRALAQFDDQRPVTEPVGPRGRVDEVPSRGLLDALPDLLRGTEFAAARILIASLDPDIDELGARVGHG